MDDTRGRTLSLAVGLPCQVLLEPSSPNTLSANYACSEVEAYVGILPIGVAHT